MASRLAIEMVIPDQRPDGANESTMRWRPATRGTARIARFARKSVADWPSTAADQP